MELLTGQPLFFQSTHAQDIPISCGLCKTPFLPASTGTNACLKCLTIQADIANGITRQAVLTCCRTCKRYLNSGWVHAEPGSKEMLSLCLRRIKGLNKVKLADACFVWTEPNSQRIKVKLTVKKELMNNFALQQTFPIEFEVCHQQCDDCKKDDISNSWGALVQIRQKAENRKTFLFLEQLILKSNSHDKALKVKEAQEGMDFFYKEKPHAMRLVNFLQKTFSVKVKHSKQLVSQDLTNASNYKHIFSIELPKVCKDDLVLLSPRMASAIGGCSNVLICSYVGSTIQFIDPVNMKTIELSSLQYFQCEDDMRFVSAKGNLTEFVTLEIQSYDGNGDSKIRTARVHVFRANDDQKFEVSTYLGDTIKEGNSMLGYDLGALNVGQYFEDASLLNGLPSIILVRKAYTEAKDMVKRIWKLKHLEKEGNEFIQYAEYEEFLQDLETDPEMRSRINLYRNEKAIKDKEQSKMDTEGALKKQSRNSKKKLKVKRNSRRAQAATGGKDGDDKDQSDGHDDEDDDNKNNKKEKKQKEKNQKQKVEDDVVEEDDPMVRIEELLADMSLEDKEIEDNDDVIEEFIRRLERVRIEGRE